MLEFILEREFYDIENLIVNEDWEIFYHNRQIPKRDYYNFYYSYSKTWQPSSILEIGVRRGYSAVSMAIGAGDSLKKFVGIDLEIDVPLSSNYAEELIRQYTKAELQFINIDTQQHQILIDLDSFDLIHINADHTFRGCFNDILLALSLSKQGTIIIVDDCLYSPVRAAFEAAVKIYSSDLEFKYVTNFRGHGLIKVSRSFPELANKSDRDKITALQTNPFSENEFNLVLDSYSHSRVTINQAIQTKDFLDFQNGLDGIGETIRLADLYFLESISKIKLAIYFYQSAGFSLQEINRLYEQIETNILSTESDKQFSLKKLWLGRKKIDDNLEVILCKKIYSRLYLLSELRSHLVSHGIGKCFEYFCDESGRHLDYLYARLFEFLPQEKRLPKLLDQFGSIQGLDRVTPSSDGHCRSYEGHLLIILLGDALINTLAPFKYTLESQYWMRYWDIVNNQTWYKLIIPGSNTNGIPTPFPVKNKVEYDDFYNWQIPQHTGGIALPQRDVNESFRYANNPTDRAFRLATTITHLKLFIELLQERHPGEAIRWLDIGCGIGYIANKVQFDGTVIGIDVAESLIDYANQSRLTENHKFITGSIEDARDLVNGEKFHLITATEIVEHIFDPLAFVRELAQHTCDLIYASSPLNEKVPYQPSRGHLWSFSLEAYASLFQTAGMKVTFATTIEVGKYIGEGHNWLSVAATIKDPFRVFP